MTQGAEGQIGQFAQSSHCFKGANTIDLVGSPLKSTVPPFSSPELAGWTTTCDVR